MRLEIITLLSMLILATVSYAAPTVDWAGGVAANEAVAYQNHIFFNVTSNLTEGDPLCGRTWWRWRLIGTVDWMGGYDTYCYLAFNSTGIPFGHYEYYYNISDIWGEYNYTSTRNITLAERFADSNSSFLLLQGARKSGIATNLTIFFVVAVIVAAFVFGKRNKYIKQAELDGSR